VCVRARVHARVGRVRVCVRVRACEAGLPAEADHDEAARGAEEAGGHVVHGAVFHGDAVDGHQHVPPLQQAPLDGVVARAPWGYLQ
jgi:hypothetical protein